MTTPTPTPPPTPAAGPAPTAGGPGTSSSAVTKFESAVGGPRNALLIVGVVLVGTVALIERHKAGTSSSNPDANATTDANSLPDWSNYYEQQQQSGNITPPPTSTTTATTQPAPVPINGMPSDTPPPILRGSTPPSNLAAGLAPAPATPVLNQSYTVTRGDSLWGIAQRWLGNGAEYPEIYNANKAVIGSNPDLIKPGERLKV